MGAFLRKALAIETRCRCPPDKWLPLGPAGESNPSGSALMKSVNAAASAAASICSRVTLSRQPYAILLAIVSSKIVTS